LLFLRFFLCCFALLLHRAALLLVARPDNHGKQQKMNTAHTQQIKPGAVLTLGGAVVACVAAIAHEQLG
jgi:hypothetical protein